MFAYAHKYQEKPFRRSDSPSHVLTISYGYHIWVCSLFPIGNSDQLFFGRSFLFLQHFVYEAMDAFYYVLLLIYTYAVTFKTSLMFQTYFTGSDHLLVSHAHFLSGKSQAEICEHYFAETSVLVQYPSVLSFTEKLSKMEKTLTVPFLFWVSVFHCPTLC